MWFPTLELLLALTTASAVSAVVVVPLNYASNISSTSEIVNRGRSRLDRINGVSSLEKRSSSGAVSNFQTAYLAAVTIGGNTWKLIVDTGSSNTWCGYLTSCEYTATECGYSSCEPTDTGVATGGNVTIIYGGAAELYSAVEYLDVVSFGGLTVHNQSIGASWVAQYFPSFCDGIFGLGPVDLTKGTDTNAATVPTFLDNLYSQGLISTEVLGVSFLPESGADSGDVNGELTLGGVDSTKYTGNLTYFPKLTTGAAAPYWGVEVASMHYGTTSVSSATQAIVDTGTTLIYIPTAAYNKFLSLSKGGTDDPYPIGSGLAFWYVRDNPTFTNFTITLGTTTYTLTPEQYLVPSEQYYAYGLSSLAYYSWITDGGSEVVTTILGQKFLEQFYSVFDTTNARVGFAPAI